MLDTITVFGGRVNMYTDCHASRVCTDKSLGAYIIASRSRDRLDGQG